MKEKRAKYKVYSQKKSRKLRVSEKQLATR